MRGISSRRNDTSADGHGVSTRKYDREKLATGIRKACEKRPLPTGSVEKLITGIEERLHELGRPEILSTTIGDMVMEGLEQLDHIAYIRFASVYREFADIGALKEALDSLSTGPKYHHNQAGSHDSEQQ